MENLAKILKELIKEAEGKNKTGSEKKAFVLDGIANLEDKTVLEVLPNPIQSHILGILIDFVIAYEKV